MSEATQTPTGRGRFYPPKIQSFMHSSYFWGLPSSSKPLIPQVGAGNEAVRRLLPDVKLESWEAVWIQAIDLLEEAYDKLEQPTSDPGTEHVVNLTLGRTLPSKGNGLARISDAVLDILGVRKWPPTLLTACSFYGCFLANVLVGAHDPETLYSNYCIDVGFFYEHGYHRVFPEFESILQSELADPVARATPGGAKRRDVAELGLEYTRRKVLLEEEHKTHLAGKTAKLSRKELLSVYLYESGICGMAAEAMARGWDSTLTATAFILSSPGTDVIDVGSDMHNSELFNSFLNTADITDSGVVTEEALQRVYDAYAFSMARMFTEHYDSPGARMLALLYTWHIHNGRHQFLRRALLGYSKIRRGEVIQRKGDLDEVFDQYMHTTGYSRRVRGACNGNTVCDQVQELFDRNHGDPLLLRIWYYVAEGPEQYVSNGVIDKSYEDDLAEGLSIAMARAVSYGCINELAWLLCHASQHAWQVNRLFEAAMFGSLLDAGGLIGRMVRAE